VTRIFVQLAQIIDFVAFSSRGIISNVFDISRVSAAGAHIGKKEAALR
jgi:hypothetical protein